MKKTFQVHSCQYIPCFKSHRPRNNSNFSSHQTMGGRLYCCSGWMHSTCDFAHFPRISVQPVASLFKLFPWTDAMGSKDLRPNQPLASENGCMWCGYKLSVLFAQIAKNKEHLFSSTAGPLEHSRHKQNVLRGFDLNPVQDDLLQN